MLEICICDDDDLMIGFYSQKIKKTIAKLYRKCNIEEFYDGKSMIDYLINNESETDVVFLDIDMPEMDGLELAKRIREKNNDIIIIFLTSMDEMVFQCFEFTPLAFIRKSKFNIEIRKTIELLIDEFDRKEELIYSITTKEGVVALNLKEVAYVECINRKPYFYTQKYTYIGVGVKFSQIIIDLKKHKFIQSHRLCIVNLDYIYKIRDIEIQLNNGFRVPMSRSNRKKVKDIFLDYVE